MLAPVACVNKKTSEEGVVYAAGVGTGSEMDDTSRRPAMVSVITSMNKNRSKPWIVAFIGTLSMGRLIFIGQSTYGEGTLGDWIGQDQTRGLRMWNGRGGGCRQYGGGGIYGGNRPETHQPSFPSSENSEATTANPSNPSKPSSSSSSSSSPTTLNPATTRVATQEDEKVRVKEPVSLPSTAPEGITAPEQSGRVRGFPIVGTNNVLQDLGGKGKEKIIDSSVEPVSVLVDKNASITKEPAQPTSPTSSQPTYYATSAEKPSNEIHMASRVSKVILEKNTIPPLHEASEPEDLIPLGANYAEKFVAIMNAVKQGSVNLETFSPPRNPSTATIPTSSSASSGSSNRMYAHRKPSISIDLRA